MPGWKAVRSRARSQAGHSQRQGVPAIDSVGLIKKRFGFVSPKGTKAKASAKKKATRKSAGKSSSGTTLVRMKSKRAADSCLGEQVVVVSRGKVIGFQG